MPRFTPYTEQLFEAGLELAAADVMQFAEPNLAANIDGATFRDRLFWAVQQKTPLVEVTFVDFDHPEMRHNDEGVTPARITLVDPPFGADDFDSDKVTVRSLEVEVQDAYDLAHRLEEGASITLEHNIFGKEIALRLPERRGDHVPLRTHFVVERVDDSQFENPIRNSKLVTHEPWKPNRMQRDDIHPADTWAPFYAHYAKNAGSFLNRSRQIVGLPAVTRPVNTLQDT